MRGVASNAANVCSTMGMPSSDWYCLGWAVPAREPLPAQGNRAKQRGVAEEVNAKVSSGEVGPHSKIKAWATLNKFHAARTSSL